MLQIWTPSAHQKLLLLGPGCQASSHWARCGASIVLPRQLPGFRVTLLAKAGRALGRHFTLGKHVPVSKARLAGRRRC